MIRNGFEKSSRWDVFIKKILKEMKKTVVGFVEENCNIDGWIETVCH